MQVITLKVDDSVYSDLIKFLVFNKNKIQIVENFDDVFTDEDRESFDIALKELANGETITLEQLEMEIANV